MGCGSLGGLQVCDRHANARLPEARRPAHTCTCLHLGDATELSPSTEAPSPLARVRGWRLKLGHAAATSSHLTGRYVAPPLLHHLPTAPPTPDVLTPGQGWGGSGTHPCPERGKRIGTLAKQNNPFLLLGNKILKQPPKVTTQPWRGTCRGPV